jgi:uncharacterized membrane protein
MLYFINKFIAVRSTTKVLLLSSAFCVLLTIFRIQWSSGLGYIFLVWNLFLAWIPFFISSFLIKTSRQGFPLFLPLLLLPAWLLFFPNAPYILTDLFHLRHKSQIPVWFDLMLILSFAWNGLMIGFLSLLDVQQFIREKFSNTVGWVFVITALIASSYGVYLGRFERWNSWDVLANPVYLLKDILGTFTHERTFGVTFLLSAFLIAGYLTLFNLIHAKKQV